MTLEKPGKLGEYFFSYFVATLFFYVQLVILILAGTAEYTWNKRDAILLLTTLQQSQMSFIVLSTVV